MKHEFITLVGSHLYGLTTPQSDKDFKGFGFESIDHILGLKNTEQQEYKTPGIEDGPNKIEGTIFTVKRYLQLCLTSNPTVIEIAFANDQYHLYSSDLGRKICKFVRENLLTKALFKPYSAYHMAQIRKLQSMNRTGKRAEMVEEHGYDLKFAMHAYRLARQCTIVMKEGTLRPTLDPEDVKVCMDLRTGGIYDKDAALKLLEDVDKEMYSAYSISTIKESPDFNTVNDFCVSLYREYVKNYNEYTTFDPIALVK